MQTNFPTDPGTQSFFLIGYRKNPSAPAQIQRTGTVLLKRTYTIAPNADPALGDLTPMEEALPIFMADVPNNLARNGGFEATRAAFGEVPTNTVPPQPGGWTAASGATVTLADDQGRQGSDDRAVRVTGTANGRVTQTVEFAAPLGGRTFTLSFYAKADAVTSIANARLEAAGAAPICVISQGLTANMVRFSATATWPANVQATALQIVLRAAVDAGRTVFYDDVQVEERAYLTEPPVTALRYEHDLAPYKPAGDLVVLDFVAAAAASVRVNGQARLSRNVGANERDLFGWNPREEATRKSEGTFPNSLGSYPLAQPLPGGFGNLYFNGYLRSATAAPPPFLQPGSALRIDRGATRYGFTLDSAQPAAHYEYYTGAGPDDDCAWRTRDVPMHLDTLVVEPDLDRCYVMWRGAWDFDERPEGPDSYRRLMVTW